MSNLLFIKLIAVFESLIDMLHIRKGHSLINLLTHTNTYIPTCIFHFSELQSRFALVPPPTLQVPTAFQEEQWARGRVA